MSSTDFLTSVKGVSYRQFGQDVFCTQIRFGTLEAIFEVDPEVQRQLDAARRLEIRRFIIESLEQDKPFFFAPFIFSARAQLQQQNDQIAIPPGAKLYILDGMHRNAAMISAISALRANLEYAELHNNKADIHRLTSYINTILNYPIAMQIYLDLTKVQERQLFTDLNTERREAHQGLLLKYDQRDTYSLLTREIAEQLIDSMEIEMEVSRLSVTSTAMTSLIAMRRCLIALFEGITTVKKGAPQYRYCSEEELVDIALAFFTSWHQLFPKQMNNRKKYVSGLTGIQIALAQTVYKLMQEGVSSYLEAISMLQLLNKQCKWTHDDPLFANLYNPTVKQVKKHSTTTAIKQLTLQFLLIIKEEGGV